MIKLAGYSCALNTDEGFNTENSDLFRLKRISGGLGESLSETVVKSSGLWSIIKYLFNKRYNQISE